MTARDKRSRPLAGPAPSGPYEARAWAACYIEGQALGRYETEREAISAVDKAIGSQFQRPIKRDGQWHNHELRLCDGTPPPLGPLPVGVLLAPLDVSFDDEDDEGDESC